MRCERILDRLIGAAVTGLIGAAAALGQSDRKVTQLSEGVYEIEHRDNQDGFAAGNTTVVLGERQVLVVDSCFLPSDAREDIAQIRQWTDKPVAFVVNTHFHNDHNLGNRVYMDAFPALTVIAQAEAAKDMGRFGPGSLARVERGNDRLHKMLDTGKAPDGRDLTADEKTYVKNALDRRGPVIDELKKVRFQGATLTFEHDLTLDLGNREVRVLFLGRGNTAGDTVVYLPREKIVAAGDLVVLPIPYAFDGYPEEWIQTLDRLMALDSDTIVPGHGPVLHDKAKVVLTRDLLQSAVDQMNAALLQKGPAVGLKLDDVKDSVDLSPFRSRFIGDDKDMAAEFDQMAASLIRLIFAEESLR